MSTPTDPKPKAKASSDAPIINEEADRVLGRLTLQALLIPTFAFLVLMFVMPQFNLQKSRFWPYHKTLDFASSGLLLVVFYWLQGRLYAKRLEIGRQLAEDKKWTQAIAALDPFTMVGARFLDSTGEAHYLLAQSYTAIGNKQKAETLRNFVRKYRPGPWAAKLGGPTGKKAAPTAEQETHPHPPKSKPKRRF